MKKLLLFLMFMLASLASYAFGAYIDGIYYNFSGNEATVTYSESGSYREAVAIPSVVTYNGAEYSVTSIGDYAFSLCSGLTFILISNSV